LIVREGRSRFRWSRELEPKSEYRRVVADCQEFSSDLSESECEVDTSLLLGAVQRLAERGEFDVDLDLLASLPGVRLINSLSVALPVAPAERQGLLEAPTPEDRRDFLLELLTMGLDDPPTLAPYEPPLVH
jgi:Lon protease-like protein